MFKFAFKHTLRSFKFLFFILKTHIVNLIKLVLIKIRLNIFRCFFHSTYFFIIMQQDFIHCNINNIIILFLPVKFISCYGILPAVLSRSRLVILRIKLSQDLAFILLLPGAMYATGPSGSLNIFF